MNLFFIILFFCELVKFVFLFLDFFLAELSLQLLKLLPVVSLYPI